MNPSLWLEANFLEVDARLARFQQVKTDEFEALLPCPGETTFKFRLLRHDASAFGLPGSSLWTLGICPSQSLETLLPTAVSTKTSPHQTPWIFKSMRVGGFLLHRRTRAALANGYQCWSESQILSRHDILRRETHANRRIFGDDSVYSYTEQPGQFHSWLLSYTNLDGQTQNPFFASIDEDLFNSAFEFRLPQSEFSIFIDTEGASTSLLKRDYPSLYAGLNPEQAQQDMMLGCWLLPNETCVHFPALHTATEKWMNLVRKCERISRKVPESEHAFRHPKISGYTSWYYHYNNISEEILNHNIKSIKEKNLDWNVFQIDDGYQAKIGDWLIPSSGFPNGLKPIALHASKAGFTPGIWCAPFIVAENSQLFSEHSDWILLDSIGNPVVCGDHPLWGGRFYALDSENREVLHYLEQVFETYFNEWGFKFLKADFLYSTSRVAVGGLTRAARAARAHEFVYAQCVRHGAGFLSCGATMAAALGRCDYSRVGADVGETWENTDLGCAPSREKVSTRGTLTNTITRSILDGVAFGADPDVIILRENKQNMTYEERKLLAEINTIFGSLVFCSDDVSEYSASNLNVLHSLKNLKEFQNSKISWRIQSINGAGQGLLPSHSASDYFTISFIGIQKTLHVNLSDQTVAQLPPHSLQWKTP